MKLIRFETKGEGPTEGVVGEDGIVYRLEGDPLGAFRRGVAVGRRDDVCLLAPCQPAKIIGIAINYEGATGQVDGMPEPLVFLKPGTCVCGPTDDIVSPFSGTRVWGEAELAVVIGKRLRNSTLEQARGGILGFTAANDVSADNIEGWDHHLARSKGADTFCPLGPWIDTAYDPVDRLVEAYQNDELIRRGRTSDRLRDDAWLVAWISSWMTLQPWDVILTGTPPRVVPRRYLADGDRFRVRIEGFPDLTNGFRNKFL